MDLFDDEFQFKPLTKGLGFHNKTVDLKEEVKNSGVVTEKLARSLPTDPDALLQVGESTKYQCQEEMKNFDDLMDSADKVLKGLGIESQKLNVEALTALPKNKKPQFSIEEELAIQLTETLPMEPDSEPVGSSQKDTFPISDLFGNETKALNFSKNVSNGNSVSFGDTKKRKKTNYVRWSAPAAILDGIITLALAFVFVISLLVVTKVNFLSTLTHAQADTMAAWSLLLLFVCILNMYMVVSRMFFGCTLGEWAFEIRLGKKDDFRHVLYPLKVIGRMLLVMITGVVFLPFLSFLFGRDIVGKICGLRLYPLGS